MPHIVPEELQMRRKKQKKADLKADLQKSAQLSSQNRGTPTEASNKRANAVRTPKKKDTKKKAKPALRNTKIENRLELAESPPQTSSNFPNPYLDEFRKFQSGAPHDIDQMFHPSLSEERREQLLDLLDLGLIEKYAWAIPSKVRPLSIRFHEARWPFQRPTFFPFPDGIKNSRTLCPHLRGSNLSRSKDKN